MIASWQAFTAFLVTATPWWSAFLGALVLSLVLVPLVRELNRKLGMVDAPSARRINKTPIPRGGGLAIFRSLLLVIDLSLE